MPDNQDFVKSIEDATCQIIAEMASRVKKACIVVETEARENCPVDMGILRASITSDVEVTENAIVGTIGSNEEYAPYVHNGTGIYAKDGNGRKTPWGYEAKAGKYKGFHWTHGQENAKLAKKSSVEKILGGK